MRALDVLSCQLSGAAVALCGAGLFYDGLALTGVGVVVLLAAIALFVACRHREAPGRNTAGGFYREEN